MSDMLTIEGFAVPILPGTQITDTPHGDFGRRYSGKASSDITAEHRVGRIVASIFDTDNDSPALRAILKSPGPKLCGGLLIGDDAYFEVRNVNYSPVTADRNSFTFELYETDESPSELLFSFDGDAPGEYTYTRTGTAPYGTYTGVYARAAANVFRREWLYLDGETRPDTAAGLLELARTNLVTSDAISGWSTTGAPTITPNISDPTGSLGAYRISGTNADYPRRTVAFTGDGVKSLCWVLKENTDVAQILWLIDTSAVANRLHAQTSAWTAGAPSFTVATGTFLGKRYLGGGYWAAYFQTTSVTAANTHEVRLPPGGLGGGTYDVWRVNAYNATYPSWSILDASEARPGEAWSQSFTAPPQAVTIYLRMIEAGNGLQSTDSEVLTIGDGPYLAIYGLINSGKNYWARHNTGSVNHDAGDTPTGLTWGSDLELRMVVNANGSVQLSSSVDAGTETTPTVSTTPSGGLSTYWLNQLVYLSRASGWKFTAAGLNVLLSMRIVTGSRTMAEMRDWARARLWSRLDTGGAVQTLRAAPASVSTAVAVESP